MRIATRTKTIAFFITLGACMVGLAIALNVSWIILNWREVVPLVLGIIFISFITAGVVLNTIFLVRELRRSEQHDSFINAVTHELKTPIASIRLYLETLQSRDLGDEQRREFYRIMLDDTDRLHATVEQVLKAGEAGLKRGRKNWQEVDFSGIINETVDLARLRHNLSPEQLRFGAPPQDGLLVMGNPDELRSAIANLVDNAVKYSGDKRDIQVDVVTPDIDRILVRVRDQGIGISSAELKRIFKRFYRTRQVIGKVKGTGLGLFIVQAIARKHGGDVSAESEGEGRGSTFTIRLPRVYRA